MSLRVMRTHLRHRRTARFGRGRSCGCGLPWPRRGPSLELPVLTYGALISVVILFRQDRRPHWVIENINLAPQSEPTPPSASFTEPTVRPPRTRRRPPTPQSPPGAARALWPPIDAAHACSELGWAPRARAQTSTQDGRGQRIRERLVANFEKVASCACVQRNCYVRESFARFGRKLSQFSSEIWATFWRNSCHRQTACPR